MFNSKGSKLEYSWHNLFEYAILIKGLFGVLETISGFLILFISKGALNNISAVLIDSELSEDPRDFLINIAAQGLYSLSVNIKFFVIAYLVLHGLLNIFLTVQLYRNKIWAYMFAIVVILVFVSYQIYRIFLYHSVILIVVTIFDLLLVALIWHERKNKKIQLKLIKNPK